VRKIIAGMELAALIQLAGCSQGIFFELKNDTQTAVEVEYTVKPDLLYEGLTPHHKVSLAPGGRERVSFSLQRMLNKGYTAKNDFIEIETYKAIFDDLVVRSQSGDTIAVLSDFTQEDVAYEHPFVSSVIFVLSMQ
jgi:hypothetical protein